MFWKKSTSKSWIIDIAGQELRIYLVRERRNNQRFSISSRGLIVRIPLMTSVLKEDRIIRDALLWTERSLEKGKVNPVNFRKFSDGLNISFFDGPRIVKFLSSEVLKGDLAWRVCLKEEGILKVYGKQPDQFSEHEALSKIVRKAVQRHYRDFLEKRLRSWNNQLEMGGVNGFRLGYTTSRWGSCQHNTGKIALSTRLTLCPLWVVDAVIVHELCHLVHNNHSKAFWALLNSKYPRYQEADRWIKEHGAKCIL